MANMDLFGSQETDEWYTPLWLFKELDNEFNFTLDPCCTKESAKCEKYYTIEDDGLRQDWSNEVVFMNPPYTEVAEWMMKAVIERANGATIVCLVYAKTDTIWWHDYAMKADEIRYIKGRLKFSNPIKGTNSAPFGSAIVIYKASKEASVTK